MQTPENLLQYLGFMPTGDIAGWTIYTNKRQGVVWFPKSPPKKKRTRRQLSITFSWIQAAKAWRGLPFTTRQKWNHAAARAHLYVAGYQLWIWWQTKRDRSALRTIEHRSGIQLVEN